MDTQTPAAPAAAPASQPAQASVRDVAVGFLNEIAENPDPDQTGVDAPEGEAVEPTEGEESQPEQKVEEAETPPPEPEIPVIEYELEDGEKVQVPEKLKPHLMRDKDYRQKTMALAEQRKAVEQLMTQAQQVATQSQQLAPYLAQLTAMDNRAQQLHEALTGGKLNDDPIEFNRAQGELAILLRNRDSLANGLQGVKQQIDAQQQKIRAEKLALDAPKLFEEVPDLAKPESQKALAEYVRNQGLSPEEIDHLNYSAAGAKLAWKAKQYDQMVKDQAAAQKKLKETVKTLPPATQSSRASNPGVDQTKLRSEWKKSGGSIDDPNFKAMLRSKLRG